MQKLDAKFEGIIRKVKDGSLVPDDEYVVFLAKDDAFFDILPKYLAACVRNESDPEQLHAVIRMIARARLWRTAHPTRYKAPDAAGGRLLDRQGANPAAVKVPD